MNEKGKVMVFSDVFACQVNKWSIVLESFYVYLNQIKVTWEEEEISIRKIPPKTRL